MKQKDGFHGQITGVSNGSKKINRFLKYSSQSLYYVNIVIISSKRWTNIYGLPTLAAHEFLFQWLSHGTSALQINNNNEHCWPHLHAHSVPGMVLSSSYPISFNFAGALNHRSHEILILQKRWVRRSQAASLNSHHWQAAEPELMSFWLQNLSPWCSIVYLSSCVKWEISPSLAVSCWSWMTITALGEEGKREKERSWGRGAWFGLD